MKAKTVKGRGRSRFIPLSICFGLGLLCHGLLPRDAPTLRGPYFGQKPPGLKPEIFAPGIVTTALGETCPAFSPDGKSFVFMRFDAREWDSEPKEYLTLITEFRNGEWTRPKPFPQNLDKTYLDWDHNFGPDGHSFYFTSRRPVSGTGPAVSGNIWKIELTEMGWTEPRQLGSPINAAEHHTANPCFTRNGTMYFTSNREEGFGKSDLYRSAWNDGHRSEPENLGSVINTEDSEFDLQIAPDESYIVFVSDRPRKPGIRGQGPDLYVSFRKKDGTWTVPQDLGADVNSIGGVAPTLTADGRYLLFVGKGHGPNSDLYWVSTKIIEKLKPENDDFPVLKGPYLGQEPPGITPELFAPEIIPEEMNSANERTPFNVVFSPDGTEMYFVTDIDANSTADIIWMRRKNDVWTKPETAPFNSLFNDLNMSFSPDGRRFFFRSKRPLPGSEIPSTDRHFMWFMDRSMRGWSEPRPVEYEGYRTITAAYQSLSNDGTLYFSTDGECGGLDIHRSRLINGNYGRPKNLGAVINTPFGEGDLFIHREESYLIVSCWNRPDNNGDSDLYISYRNEDGSWTALRNMGNIINSSISENCPMVTADDKYFFFTRYDPAKNRGETYWVDARIIYSRDDFPQLSGPYLGQEPPGLTPELFAPTLLSRSKPEWAFCASFAPGGREFYFVSDGTQTDREQIVRMNLENGIWSKPAPLTFSGPYLRNNFGFSPDGSRIFFRTWTPLPGDDPDAGTSSLWFAEREGDGWSEPLPLKCGGRFIRRAGQPSVSENGTLYFAARLEDSLGGGDVYRSRFVNGAFNAPESLGRPLNTEYSEADLCVAPDESFLIVTCWERPDTAGESDLYISFQREDGTWSALNNMGAAINNQGNESAPTLSPDGKYLFYVRVDISGQTPTCDTYWVDLRIIEQMQASDPDNWPVLEGPYLGQKPPGRTPELFAPGVISTGYDERNIVFSPDGKELFYGLYGAPHGVFIRMSEIDGRWTKPRVASFSGRYQGELGISPDGNTIVFSSNEPFENSPDPAEYWIWSITKEGSEWEWPAPLGPAVNSGRFAGYPSLSGSGNLYFFSEREEGMGGDDIYFSEWTNGRYAEARNIGSAVNTELEEVDPCIAPDESFLIFCRRLEDRRVDLFVTFRREDGTWSPARNLGDGINSEASDFCPSISADGKYLFFTSSRSRHATHSPVPLTYEQKIRILESPENGNTDIYWVDARVLNKIPGI